VKARFLSTADAELAEAVDYYTTIHPGLGLKFLVQVEAAVRLIETHPEAWLPVSPRTRRCRVRHFPFGPLYQLRANEILVLSVMDLRRDPKRWEHLL